MYFSNKVDQKIIDVLIDWAKSVDDKKLFFAEFYFNVKIIEKKNISTFGIWINNLKVEMIYNKEFLDKLSKKELEFVLIHEASHILWNDTNRLQKQNKKRANYAQDMIHNDFIFENFSNIVDIKKIKPLSIPEEYKGQKISECLYKFLEENKEGNEEESEEGSKEGNVSGQFDEHIQGEMTKIDQEIVKDIVASIKNRGKLPLDIEQSINNLTKKKNYTKLIASYTNQLIGHIKQSTWKKYNKKLPGKIKGHTKQSKNINVIIDTSGSMNNEFDTCLSYIFQNNININLIQCDVRVSKIDYNITKNKLKKIMIKGGGGTELQPGIEYLIKDKKLKNNNLLILTDGYCDNLNLRGIKKTLILTTGIKVNCSNHRMLKQIIID